MSNQLSQEAKNILRDKGYGSIETTRLLEDSLAISYSTEEIGMETIDNLLNQRDLLIESQANVEDVEHITSLAKKTLNIMKRKIFLRKCHLFTIVVTLFILDIFLFVFMLTHGGKLYQS